MEDVMGTATRKHQKKSHQEKSLGQAILTLEEVGSEQAKIVRITPLGIDVELNTNCNFQYLDVITVDYQLAGKDPECDKLAVIISKNDREIKLRFAA